MKALLRNYRQSPRKVRLVTDLVKRKNVTAALATLDALPKRASGPISKLIRSAVANAVKNNGAEADSLFIKDFRVDGGVVLKRMMPGARGRGYQIKKRTSHVSLELGARAMRKPTVEVTAAAPAPTKVSKPSAKVAKATEAKS